MNLSPFLFLRRTLPLAIAIVMLASIGVQAQTPSPTHKPVKASAMLVTVRVSNFTTTCAWVTIYWSRALYPWSIEGGTNGRPRFVHPNGFFDFKVPFTNPLEVPIPAQIKVRAEVTRNKDCSGGTIADLSAENKGIMADPGSMGLWATVASGLEGQPGSYRLSAPKH